ncbi:SCO family protein [Polyangium mundeleinium]|uniref:SCO family protein n=1 Tax=Polyangium mundeleinium TaxID=2995306 RepID=A0ABT5F671_9BACT|nr:SCO family protein [Polyangium mundeleinium]MDC0748632.1 SCO family protein [Polyangium mundeleinium]
MSMAIANHPLRHARALVLVGAAILAAGCEGESKGAPPVPLPTPGADVRIAPLAEVVVPDVELVDQDGQTVPLRAALGPGAFAIQFVFTTCTTICSPMTAVFARLAHDLGDSFGKDVRLVSLTLDPAIDGPEALRRYADLFGRREGWTFLTGRPDRLSRVLRALGGDARVKEEHRPLTVIGDGQGKFVLVDGLASPARLRAEIAALRRRAETTEEP